MNSKLDEISEMVETASRRYVFRRLHGNHTLIRESSEGEIERLVRGLWIDSRRPRALDNDLVWKPMSVSALGFHVRRYFIDDLGSGGMGWQGRIKERFRRGAFWRWVMPPPKGGANLGPESVAVIKRSESSVEKELEGVGGADLAELKEEALSGLQFQRDRLAAVEQRASFFIGAAGLTTSLVLANAGLLIGTGKLNPPFLALAAGALTLASACAVVCGFRAIQATMFEFAQLLPHTVAGRGRANMTGDRLVQAYVAGAVVAEFRERAIAEWKSARLASARRWFLGTIAGVVMLTAFVLVEAV